MKIKSFLLLFAGVVSFGLGNAHPEPVAQAATTQATQAATTQAEEAATTQAPATTAGYVPPSGASVPGWPSVDPKLLMAYAFLKNYMSTLPPLKGNESVIDTWNNNGLMMRATFLKVLFPRFWDAMDIATKIEVIFLYITPFTPAELGEDAHYPPMYTRFSDRDLPFFLDSIDSFVAGGGLAELWNAPTDMIMAIQGQAGAADNIVLDIRAVCDVATDGLFEVLGVLPEKIITWVKNEVTDGIDWFFGDAPETTATTGPAPVVSTFAGGPNPALVNMHG